MGESIVRRNSVLKSVLLAMLLLSLAAPAMGLQQSGLKFTWIDEDIRFVSRNNPIPAVMKFDFTVDNTESPVTSILVDASEMYNDLRLKQYYTAIFLNPNTCEDNAGTMSCKLSKSSDGRQLSLRVSQPDVTVRFKFTHEDGTVTETEETVTFTFDNTRPLLKFIGTEHCDSNGKCYGAAGKPNKIIIQFEDTQATFNRGIVAFRLGNRDSYVDGCDGLTCTGFVTPICTSRQVLRLLLIPYRNMPSQDDAGNPVRQASTFSVVCDPDVPVIVEKKVFSSSGLDAITMNDQIIVQVNVTEVTSPSVDISVNASPVGAGDVVGTCVKVTDQFICTATISPSTQISGNYNLKFRISDLAGNFVDDTISFTLLGVSDQTNVDLWDVKKVSPSSSRVNIRNLLYDRDFIYEVELKAKRGSPKIVSLTTGDTCSPKRENRTGNLGDITKLTLLKLLPESNKIYLKVTLRDYGSLEDNRYERFNKLEYDCPVKVVSKNYNQFYSAPEEVNFTIKYNLYSDDTFEDSIKQEINQTLESINERQRWIGIYGSSIGKIKIACDAVAAFSGVAGIAGSVAEILAQVARSLSGTPYGPSAYGNARLQEGISTSIGKSAESLAEIIEPLCKYLTCKESISPLHNYITDQWDDLGEDWDIESWGGYVGVDNLSDAMNPWKSEVVAWSSLCLPAMVYHQEVRQGIQCTYLECLSYGVGKTGKDVADCQQEKSYSECIIFSEGLTNFIPFTAMFKDVASTIHEIASDPYTLFGTLGVGLYCSKLVPIWGGKGACNAVAMFQEATDIINQINNFVNAPTEDSSSCDRIFNQLDPKTLQWKFLSSASDPPGTNLKTPNQLSQQIIVSEPGKPIETATCQLGLCRLDSYPNIWIDARDALVKQGDKLFIDPNKVIIFSGTRDAHLRLGTYVDVKAQLKERKVASGRDLDLDVTTGGDNLDQESGDLRQIDGKIRKTIPSGDESDPITEEGSLQILTKDGVMEQVITAAEQNPLVNEEFYQLMIDQYKELDEDLAKRYDKTYTELDDWNYILTENTLEVTELEKRLATCTKPAQCAEYKKRLKLTNEIIKEAKEEIAKIEGDMIDIGKDAEDARIWEFYWGTAADVARTTMNFGRQVAALKNMIGVQFGHWGTSHFMTDVLDTLDEAAHFERVWCAMDGGNVVDSGGSYAVNQIGTGVFESGIYLNPRKAKITDPLNQDYYEYWISGGVSSKKKDGLSFKIIISGLGGEKDITRDVTGSSLYVVPLNREYIFSGSGTYRFNDTKSYSRVCIDFRMSKSQIIQFFDDVGGMNDGKFCRDIISE